MLSELELVVVVWLVGSGGWLVVGWLVGWLVVGWWLVMSSSE
ncbi:hypothetical protein THIOSC13_370014 [uncultured Thiomicrorhabdus sp.]